MDLAKGGQTTFESNRYGSALLSLWGFLLHFLSFLFLQVPNLWFSLIVLLDLVVLETPIMGFGPLLAPLFFVFAVDFAHQFATNIQQISRYQAINSQLCSVWTEGEFEQARWDSLQVGNYVLLKASEKAPADLILIATGLQNRGCYVECSGITGDFSLVQKTAVKETALIVHSQSLLHATAQVAKLAGALRLGEPCADYNTFEATLKLPRTPKAETVSIQQFVMRGSIVRVAPWVIGLVVYTGKETKTGLCLDQRKVRKSSTPISTWTSAIALLVLLTALGLALAKVTESGVDMRVAAFLVVLSPAVPLSILTALQIVRLGRFFLFARTLVSGGGVELHTLDIAESLGKVEYVFVEPGALIDPNPRLTHFITEECEFVRENNELEDMESFDFESFKLKERSDEDMQTFQPSDSTVRHSNFTRLKAIGSLMPSTVSLCECLCLCANLVHDDDGQLLPLSLEERAVMQTLQKVGSGVDSRSGEGCSLTIFGEKRYYEVLSPWENSPETKCWRCIVCRPGHGTARLYVQGRFAVMGNVLDLTSDEYKILEEKIGMLEGEGVVPIVCGYADLTAEKTTKLKSDFSAAHLISVDLQLQVRKIYESLQEEESVKLLGLAGLFMPAYKEAQEAVQTLSAAGLKIWLASSSSESVTLAVALNAGVVRRDETVVRLQGLQSEEALYEELVRAVRCCILRTEKRLPEFNKSLTDYGVQPGKRLLERLQDLHTPQTDLKSAHFENLRGLKCSAKRLGYSLLIDNQSLSLALSNSQSRQLLAILCFSASSVCGSGLQPELKRELARFVKRSFVFRPVTLAVTSDSSGIGMMQNADIGMALKGRNRLVEGLSDMAIGQIGLLPQVILQQGVGNYYRVARTVRLFLFNHVVIGTVLGGYAVISDFDGTLLIEPGLVVAYSFLFTAFPAVLAAILPSESQNSAYMSSVLGLDLHWKKLVATGVSAFGQGIFLAFCLYASNSSIQMNGFTADFSSMGVMALIMLVQTANWQQGMEVRNWKWGVGGGVLGLGVMFLYLGIASIMPSSDLFSALEMLFSRPTTVLTVLISPLITPTLHVFISGARPKVSQFEPVPTADSPDLPSPDPFSRFAQFQAQLDSVYLPAYLPPTLKSSEVDHIDPVTIQFSSNHIEAEYRVIYIGRHLQLIRAMLVSMWLMMVLWIGVDSVMASPSDSYTGYKAGVAVLFLLAAFLTLTKWFLQHYVPVVLVIMVIGLVSKCTAEFMYNMIGGMGAAMLPMATYIFLNVDFVWVSVMNAGNIVLFTASAVAATSHLEPLTAALTILCYEVLLMGLTFLAAQAGYQIELADRLAHRMRANTLKEVEKSRNILSLLLPAFVIPRVINRAEGAYIAEDQGLATVIFCDMCDFETICAVYKPQELMLFLDEVFQRFDGLCQRRGVAKIETVGKTYMACAGLMYVDTDLSSELVSISHPRRALDFAFDLLLAAKSFRLKTGKSLQLKIGINSGPVISGVVGHHKPQFSLVGDTVNTASRMCSTLEQSNSVQISTETKELLVETECLHFDSRVITAKGKGRMSTYIVTRLEENGGRSRSSGGGIGREELQRSSVTMAVESGSEIKVGAENKPALAKCFPVTETTEEREFRLEVLKEMHPAVRWNFLSVLITQFCLFMLRTLQWGLVPELANYQVLLAYGLLVLLPGVGLGLQSRFKESRWYPLARIPVYILAACFTLVDFQYGTKYPADLTVIDIMALYLLATWSGANFFKPSLALALFLAVLWLAILEAAKDIPNHFVQLVFLVIYAGINAYAVYGRERQINLHIKLRSIEAREISKNEKLLGQMMPKSVYTKLKADLSVTDQLRNVTILFADIVGFTNWSASKTPTEVVGMLAALFTQFDLLCLHYKVYKVHTIGDCYVVLGLDGTSEAHVDPNIGCLRVLCFAMELIRVINEVNTREGIGLNMRIGLHTGEVIAGITGKDVIRYDIYGPAVMVANKMESGGSAGRVNVSEVTREVLERLVPQQVQYEKNAYIEAKAIDRRYMSYFVQVRDLDHLAKIALEA